MEREPGRDRRAWTVALAPLVAAAIACGPTAGGHPHDPLREVKTVNNPPSLNPDWLKAQGFHEDAGQFVHRSIPLKTLSRLLGFSPQNLEAEPGLPPDEQRCTVTLKGGRCTLDYDDPYVDSNDPEALVTARVELSRPGNP